MLRALVDGAPTFTLGAAGQDGEAREGAARREGKGLESGSVALGFRKCVIYRFFRDRVNTLWITSSELIIFQMEISCFQLSWVTGKRCV